MLIAFETVIHVVQINPFIKTMRKGYGLFKGWRDFFSFFGSPSFKCALSSEDLKFKHFFARSYFLFNLRKKEEKRNLLGDDSFFYHFEGRDKNECSTFVEQCLKKFFSFPFECLFVFIFFVRKNKLCRVSCSISRRGRKSFSKILLIKRKSSCVFKLNKTQARGCFQDAFNKWQQSNFPSARIGYFN